MGTSYELTATVREKVGKGAASAVRREGQIPAVIYGGNKPPVAIHLSDRDCSSRFTPAASSPPSPTIKVNGETIRTLPRDFQLDPVSDRPLHVDFLRIVAGSKIKVEVPVQFINESDAPGIKRGGVLNVVRHRVELLCPADGIPTGSSPILPASTSTTRCTFRRSRCRKAFGRPSPATSRSPRSRRLPASRKSCAPPPKPPLPPAAAAAPRPGRGRPRQASRRRPRDAKKAEAGAKPEGGGKK